MTTTHASPLARPLSHILKPALAMLAAFLVGGARGDWLWWDNGGNDTTFTTPENWSTDIFPGTGNVAAFEGDSTGKTIVFAAEGTQVGDVFVRNNWWNSETLSPVVFSASDSANGFASLGVFSCADIGGATYGCRSALTIQSGTYTAANTSYWGWGANAGLSMVIDGESRVVLNSGLNMMYGGFEDTANNIPWSNIGNVTNKIDIKSGALVVNGGNVLIGTNSDWSKTTINVGDADGNGATTGEFSVGSATTHSLKLSEYGCAGTTVEININKGGNLKAYNIIDGGGTGDPELSVVFNGGTLVALGVGDTSLVGEGITVVAGSNGGIIDAGANNVTIAAPVTGAGTITKKGTGTLTFTGDLSGFVGRVAVASGAGSVTLPATATRARAGDYTSVVENQDGTFTFAYDANGSASATASVELLNLDFEDENTYGVGWTFSSDGYGGGERHSLATRELYEEESVGVYKTSKFLMLEPYTGNGNRGSKAVYDLSAVFASADEYTLEFDYFAGMCYSDYNYLELNTANGRIVYFYTNYDSKTPRQTKVYLNGSETVAGAFSAADRAQYPNNAEYKSKWVHVIVTASQKKGIRLTVRSADGNSNVLQETFVTDFDRLTSFVASARNKFSTGTSASGIDNVVATIPGVASVDGVNYATFASAVDAATSTSTITLYSDVELTSSVELPYGVTVDLNGNILYTSDDNVAVIFNDGVHYLESVTAGGVKTFSDVITMDDTVYVWTGATDNTWGNNNNWNLGGSLAANAPGATDEVLIPEAGAPWTINVASDASVSKITVNGATTFSGGTLRSSLIAGAAQVTLNGLNLGPIYSVSDLHVYNAINVAGSNNIYLGGDKNNAANVHLHGDLSGSGSITANHAGKQGIGVKFYGSNGQFAGTFTSSNYALRDATDFDGWWCSSSNAVWNVSAWNKNNNTFLVKDDSQTTYFGALNGTLQVGNNRHPKIEVGNRGDINSEFIISQWTTGAAGWDITKVGAGLMTVGFDSSDRGYNVYKLANLYIKSGIVMLSHQNAAAVPTTSLSFLGDGATLRLAAPWTDNETTVNSDPSAVIKNSTSAIAFDSNGSDYTWSFALASSNVGGLVKKGAGTLTLSAVPAYTGTTKVEAGALYVVEGGEWTPTLDPATAEVASDMAGYRKFIPSTLSVSAPVVGAYGNDFATVDVTANVDSTYASSVEVTYTLKTNGVAAATTTAAGNATSVTFSGVDISGLSRYGNISYTVEASGESVTAATSGATTAMLADADGWVDEKKSTTGRTGSWKTADGEAATVTYDNETEMASLSDNKFSATNCSTGDVVTVTIKDVVYDELSDTSTVDADAQGAVALSTNVVNDVVSTNFFVLTRSNDVVSWTAADGVAGNTNVAYDIELTFDYVNGKYSVSINGTALTIGGVAAFDIVKTANQYVKDIDFLGAGSIKAIEGVQYDAMMAVDQNGVRYATVQEAVSANAGKKGATVTLLHDTANTSFTGWKYDAELKMFIWSVCGVMFLIF